MCTVIHHFLSIWSSHHYSLLSSWASWAYPSPAEHVSMHSSYQASRTIGHSCKKWGVLYVWWRQSGWHRIQIGCTQYSAYCTYPFPHWYGFFLCVNWVPIHIWAHVSLPTNNLFICFLDICYPFNESWYVVHFVWCVLFNFVMNRFDCWLWYQSWLIKYNLTQLNWI